MVCVPIGVKTNLNEVSETYFFDMAIQAFPPIWGFSAQGRFSVRWT